MYHDNYVYCKFKIKNKNINFLNFSITVHIKK